MSRFSYFREDWRSCRCSRGGWTGAATAGLRRRLEPRRALARPQPTEGARGQERVGQSVDRRLDRGAPRSVVPDRRLPERDRVSDERRGADELEYAKVGRTGGQRAPRHVGGEDADDRAVDEPEDEALRHRRGAVRYHREHHHRAFFHLFRKCGRAHLLHARRAGDHVLARRHGERAELVPQPGLVRHLGEVVFVPPGQGHVDHGARDEDDHRRQQDREPQRGQSCHDGLLWLSSYSRYDGSIVSSFLMSAGHSRMPSLRRTPGWYRCDASSMILRGGSEISVLQASVVTWSWQARSRRQMLSNACGMLAPTTRSQWFLRIIASGFPVTRTR